MRVLRSDAEGWWLELLLRVLSYSSRERLRRLKNRLPLVLWRASVHYFPIRLKATAICMRVFLKRSGKAEVLCATSSKAFHLARDMEGVNEDGVEFEMSTAVCERNEWIWSKNGDRNMLLVPQEGEDVVPVFSSFAKTRCQGFSKNVFSDSSTLQLYETLRGSFFMAGKRSHEKQCRSSSCVDVMCNILKALADRCVYVFFAHLFKSWFVTDVSDPASRCD